MRSRAAQPPIAQKRRRPRYVFATFWALVTAGATITGFSSNHWGLLVALITGAYTAYLYRGGRFAFLFF